MATVRKAVALGADMVIASSLLEGKEEANVEIRLAIMILHTLN